VSYFKKEHKEEMRLFVGQGPAPRDRMSSDTCVDGAALTTNRRHFLFMSFLNGRHGGCSLDGDGTAYIQATSELFHSLQYLCERHQHPWTVAAMLPIRTAWPGLTEKSNWRQTFLLPLRRTVLAPASTRCQGGLPALCVGGGVAASSKRDHGHSSMLRNVWGRPNTRSSPHRPMAFDAEWIPARLGREV